MSKITISTDHNKLDIPYIHNFLTDSYWGKGRTIEAVQKSINHSRCYGIYLDDRQIGFARLVSDMVVFAYLMDVFIDKDYNGKGYAQQLINFILEDPELSDVKKWGLRTRDAHTLYEKVGFKPLANPSMSMEKWESLATKIVS